MVKSLLGPKQKLYIDQGRGKISDMLPYGTEVNVLRQSGVLAIKYTIGNFEKTIKITLDKSNVIKVE